MLAGHLALVIAAVFTGAAVYINVAEQPARMRLDDRSLLTQWKLSYQRGFMMQATLAALGALLGLIAFFMSSDARWLLGTLVLFANWPFTLFLINPTNSALAATAPESAGVETRRLMEKWSRLHAVRSVLGALSTAIFLWALH